MSLRLLIHLLVLLFVAGCASTGGNQGQSTEKGIAVTQTDRGAMVSVSERILFETSKYELRKETAEILDKLAKVLNERTRKDIVIEGHTDNVGSASFNRRLSEQRADAVRSALLERGVAKARLQIQGLGLSKPKVPNDTEEGRRINRRVEIIVLGESKETLGGNSFELSLNAVWTKFKQIFQ